MSAYEVDAATMCDALSHVPGVEHVVLEFDEAGNGVLRVQVVAGENHASVVGAAVLQMRHRFGLGVDHQRLRLTGPTGRPVVAVVETLDDVIDPPPSTDPLSRLDGEAQAALREAVEDAFDSLPETPLPSLESLPPLPDLAGLPRLSDLPPLPDLPELDRLLRSPDVLPLPEQPSAAGLVPGRPLAQPGLPGQPSQPGQHVERPMRVVVDRVVVSTEGHSVRALVRLRNGDAYHEGIATRPDTGAGAHRALAAATASAIEAVVSSSARLEVEQVDLLQVGTDHVAVVVLSLLSASGIDRLTGSALVRSDARDAVVRATLDALNRRAGMVGKHRRGELS